MAIFILSKFGILFELIMPALASQGNRRHMTNMFDWEYLRELWLILDWQDAKTVIVDYTHLSRDALHVYIALLIFLGACSVFRWKPASWKPWFLVLAVQTLNEILDMRGSYEADGVIWIWSNIKDMVNTMIAPTLLLFAARYFRIFGSTEMPTKPISSDKPEV